MTILIVFIAPLGGEVLGQDRLALADGRGLALLSASLSPFSMLDLDRLLGHPPGLLLGGVGMSLAMTPTTAAAMGPVPVDKAGVGSAVLEQHAPGRRVARHRRHGRNRRGVDHCRARRPTGPRQFIEGYQNAPHVAAAIAIVGAAVAVLTVRKVHHPEVPVLEGA